MSREKLFGIVSLSASALTVWLYLLIQVPPKSDDLLLMATFFVSLTVWLGSICAALLYGAKIRLGNREVIYAHLRPSIRQGFLIALVASVLLFLQLIRVLTFWDGLIVVVVALAFEIAAQYTAPVRRHEP